MSYPKKIYLLFLLFLFFNLTTRAGNVYYNSHGELLKTEGKTFKKKNHYFIVGESGKLYKLSKQGLDVVNGKFGPFEGLVEDWQTNNSEEGLIARTKVAISGYRNGNVVRYILKESKDIAGCLMNQKVNLSISKLYVFNNCAYNSNEAGNVIWGAAMYVFGFKPALTWCCSHGGTYLLKHRLDEQYEALAAYKGSRYLKKAKEGSTLSQIVMSSREKYSEKPYQLTSLVSTLMTF